MKLASFAQEQLRFGGDAEVMNAPDKAAMSRFMRQKSRIKRSKNKANRKEMAHKRSRHSASASLPGYWPPIGSTGGDEKGSIEYHGEEVAHHGMFIEYIIVVYSILWL